MKEYPQDVNPGQWASELRQSSNELVELLANQAWAELPFALQQREQLFKQIFDQLEFAALSQNTVPSQQVKVCIKNELEEALLTNRQALSQLQDHREELIHQLKNINRGRRALNLYLLRRQARPRFLDRYG